MKEQSTKAVVPSMPIARFLPRAHAPIALAYVAGYVLLDWVSYVHPFDVYGITPWNPQTGLSFALILLFGRSFLPWLVVAPFLADLVVRQMPLPFGVELLVVLTIGLGYGAATSFLLIPRVGFDATLSSRRALLLLMSVALVSIAIVTLGHVSVLFVFGILAREDFVQAALRAFVGDTIGVTVVTPFLLILFTRRKLPTPTWEMLALSLLVIAALWAVFGFAEAFRFQLFYAFFIPIVWVAVRFGLEGVTAALVLTQIGLIAAIQVSGQSTVDVVAYQALLVVLAITGLSIGVLVSEQQRTQQRLRLQQEALNRAFRLGTMGEFAAAIAHEINQPLTAIANYARLAKRAAESQPPDADGAAAAAANAVQQTDRASEVIRRLRDFIRLGRSETEATDVDVLVHDALLLCRPELERAGIEPRTRLARNLPPVMVDPLQIHQVIVNLIRNSLEALSQAGRVDGRLSIEAKRAGEHVEVSIADNGPGFDGDIAGDSIAAFATTKYDGLGLGLSLARSIVEAHGGRLRIDSGPRGASVSFTLKTAAGNGEEA
jgi:two-component system, LuxR family, sensor kinase FixL